MKTLAKTLFILVLAIVLFGSCEKEENECIQTVTVYHNDNTNKQWVFYSEQNQSLSVDNQSADISGNSCMNGVYYTDSTKTIVSTICD